MRTFWATLALFIGLAMSTIAADTFTLTTGESLVGELLVSSANDLGIQVKVGEGDYKRVSWSNFSQDDLKKMAQNPKLQAFVEPFIEVTPEERLQRTEVKTVPPPRLALPEKKSLVTAMVTSPLGIFIVLLLYAANLYAAYEVSIFRAQAPGLVCGVSAVLPLIGPLIFLAMPTKFKKGEQAEAEEATTGVATPGSPPAAVGSAPLAGGVPRPLTPAAADEDDDNPMHAKGAVHPTSLHLAHEEPQKPKHPAPTIFKRGQFTFNRRFFETRFPGMFGVVKREADKDMVLLIKSNRGEFIGTRISRIAANDVHLQVEKGGASEEVMIPFTEIQEIQHKHKDA